MVANHEGLQSQYPTPFYNPESNPACGRVYKAYGKCCGPCDGPCYIVQRVHYLPAWPDDQAGGDVV